VSPFGLRHIDARLRRLGCETSLRTSPDGSPYVTDGGHNIIDCRFARIDSAENLELAIRRIPGVFETGLFLGLCDSLIVGHDDRVEVFDR
jgi:ribose 5-phosphate isomerase A